MPDIDPSSLLTVLDAEFSELYDIVQIECPAGFYRVSALEHLNRAREAARLAVQQPAATEPPAPDAQYVLRSSASVGEALAGVRVDASGNFMATTTGRPAELAALLRFIATEIEDNVASRENPFA